MLVQETYDTMDMSIFPRFAFEGSKYNIVQVWESTRNAPHVHLLIFLLPS